MKWLLSILLFLATESFSQNGIRGQWYHISTQWLMEMQISDDRVSWTEWNPALAGPGRIKNSNSLLAIFQKGPLFGLIQKDDDTTELQPYSLQVIRYIKGAPYLDLLMECSGETFEDSTGLSARFVSCKDPDEMVMRFYSRAAIDSFRALKPVANITKKDQSDIRSLFKRGTRELEKKYGEDKLLWIAPIIFQQLLTDLLLAGGYNPIISEKEAEELFEFNFF